MVPGQRRLPRALLVVAMPWQSVGAADAGLRHVPRGAALCGQKLRRALEPNRAVPRNRRPAYRFAWWPDDDRLGRLMNQAYGMAAAAHGREAVEEPELVRNPDRELRPVEEFLEGGAVGLAAGPAGGRPGALPVTGVATWGGFRLGAVGTRLRRERERDHDVEDARRRVRRPLLGRTASSCWTVGWRLRWKWSTRFAANPPQIAKSFTPSFSPSGSMLWAPKETEQGIQ